MLRLAVHPDGLPSISSMTPACGIRKRKSRDSADEALGELIHQIESSARPIRRPGSRSRSRCASLDLHTRLGEVSLFTIIATLGAPLEVTAASLAIETFLPADAASAARLRELAAHREPAAATA